MSVYEYSRQEAKQSNEFKLWRDSYVLNQQCREAIEQSIRIHYDGTQLDSAGVQDVIDKFGFDRVHWVLAATVRTKEYAGQFSQDNKKWAKSIIPSHLKKEEFSEYAVDSDSAALAGFIRQVCKAYEDLNLLDVSHCVADSWKEDYTEKLLILRSKILKPEYQKPEFQYFYARSGFGCAPDRIGTSVQGCFLIDGENTAFRRSDFLGIADEAQLPEWAVEKLSQIREPEEAEDFSFSQA